MSIFKQLLSSFIDFSPPKPPGPSDELKQLFIQTRSQAEMGSEQYLYLRDQLANDPDAERFLTQLADTSSGTEIPSVDPEILAQGVGHYIQATLNPLWAMNAVGRLFLRLQEAAESANPNFEQYRQNFVQNADLVKAAGVSEVVKNITGDQPVITFINQTLAKNFKSICDQRVADAKTKAEQDETAKTQKALQDKITKAEKSFFNLAQFAASGDPAYSACCSDFKDEKVKAMLADSEAVTRHLKGQSIDDYLTTLDKQFWPARSEHIVQEILNRSGDVLKLWSEIREPFEKGLLRLDQDQLQILSLELVAAYTNKYEGKIQAANNTVSCSKASYEYNGYQHWAIWHSDWEDRRGCKSFYEDVKKAFECTIIAAKDTFDLVTPSQLGLHPNFFIREAEKMSPPTESEYATEAAHIAAAKIEILHIAEQLQKMDEKGKLALQGEIAGTPMSAPAP